MGWSYTYKPKGQKILDFFRERFEDDNHKILDGALVGGFHGTFYGALKGKDGLVSGIVCLVHMVPKSHYNFGYKEMGEFSGPGASDCPERILKLLSPLESFDYGEQSLGWAREWRERCWARVSQRKATPKISGGDIVTFEKPIFFADGQALSRFRVLDAKRNKFTSLEHGTSCYYKLHKEWRRTYLYTVEKGA